MVVTIEKVGNINVKVCIMSQFKIFDAHFHIIDKSFPLVANHGYLPDEFSVKDYRLATKDLSLCGGAVVSGSFQAYDQSYLIAALKSLGPNYVGVTQLPIAVSDKEILSLHQQGVRALRFNVKRGQGDELAHLDTLARRAYDLAGWHIELYIDAKALADILPIIVALPKVSIDHLGLSLSGQASLLKLAEKGVKVKATGFGRVDFDVSAAIKALYQANPHALMFGTDHPSTRAPRTFLPEDIELVLDALGEEQAADVFWRNAWQFYRCD